MKTLNIIFVSIALLIAGMNVSFAQIAIRVDLCMPTYKTTCFDPIQLSRVSGLGLQFGVDYDIHVKNKFHITPGLYLSCRAALADASDEGTVGSELLQENFINVPIHTKWKFDVKPGKFAVYLFIGPTFSWAMSSRSYLDMAVSGYQIQGTYDYLDGRVDVEVPGFSDSVSDELNAILQKEFDAAGIRHNDFEGRLDWGIGLVFKDNYELVLIGYDFGLNNKYAGTHGDKYYMTCDNYYIGFRYRFGGKDR